MREMNLLELSEETRESFKVDFFDGDMLRQNSELNKNGAEASISDSEGENIVFFFIPIEGNNKENLIPEDWFNTLGEEESVYYTANIED